MSTTVATTAPSSGQAGSKRWTHFHAALQLAIQRAAHKWTYSDFTECFPLWCEEEPDGAYGVFNTVSRHIESLVSTHCDQLFEEYNVKENIDILHAVVTEARARKERGEIGNDVWREDLRPRQAVRAKTVPLLVSEHEKLKAKLAELEEENRRLQSVLQQNVKERQGLDDKAAKLLDLVDNIYAEWDKLSLEEMETWTVQTAESSSATHPMP